MQVLVGRGPDRDRAPVLPAGAIPRLLGSDAGERLFSEAVHTGVGVGPDAGLDMAVLDMVQEQITEHEGLRWMDIRHAGALFEELMDKHLLLEDGKADVVNSMNKRPTECISRTGPSSPFWSLRRWRAIRTGARRRFRPADHRSRHGGGFFPDRNGRSALRAHRRKSELAPAEIRRRVLCGCIYGIDKNPVAVDIAMFTLWLTELQGDEAFPSCGAAFWPPTACCWSRRTGRRRKTGILRAESSLSGGVRGCRDGTGL